MRIYGKKITAMFVLAFAVCFAAGAHSPVAVCAIADGSPTDGAAAANTSAANIAAESGIVADNVAADGTSEGVVADDGISAHIAAGNSEVSDAVDGDEADSIVMTPNRRREQRGISQPSIEMVPKGQWIFGGTASYSTHSNNSYSFLVIEGIESKGYTFKISPMIGYGIRSNMAIGARFIYSRSLLKIDDAKISMEDINLGVENYYALKHSYEVAAMWRQYIPLGGSKRFGLFTECQLAIGGTQAKFVEGSPVRGTFETGYTVSLGLNPGIVAFATDNIAFELNVGVLGFNYTNTRQVHNQVTVGNRSSSYMNFKVNIFSIGVGMAFYL